ncbi:hypothetical protein SpAn4DRAFT_2776 [Sporomusa ovata]|uniref:Uncharacterized protein n=1 Tax=Sporomusa ovata TaxID=2378 RepID=A0A0U1KY69_9FIRM|nr:hypothetical protein SpAn4DRAFT_2776 [Sporomusa ovata]
MPSKIPDAPKAAAQTKKVCSRMRHSFLRARRLSSITIRNAAKFHRMNSGGKLLFITPIPFITYLAAVK